MIVFVNGAFTEAGLQIAVGDRGFLLGDGVFETIYVKGGRAAFLDAHLARLRKGLAALRIDPPADLSHLGDIIAGLASQNDGEGDPAARVTISRGAGARGLAFPASGETPPTMLATLVPYAAPAGPARLTVSARRRYSGGSTLAFKAVGGYAENMLALDEARRAGADDALLLNEHGRIVCASASNLFLIDDKGRLATPALSEGAMQGVTRTLVIEGAGSLGLEVSEQKIKPGDLTGALLFLTNSLAGLRPACIDGGGDAENDDAFRALRTWYGERLAAETGTP
ncbi:MAG: aminotransferase class IV [Amphiplicatus sp.]